MSTPMPKAEASSEEPRTDAPEQPVGRPSERPVERPTAPDPDLENITEPGRPPRTGKFFP
jgi:hypothetical protein